MFIYQCKYFATLNIIITLRRTPRGQPAGRGGVISRSCWGGGRSPTPTSPRGRRSPRHRRCQSNRPRGAILRRKKGYVDRHQYLIFINVTPPITPACPSLSPRTPHTSTEHIPFKITHKTTPVNNPLTTYYLRAPPNGSQAAPCLPAGPPGCPSRRRGGGRRQGTRSPPSPCGRASHRSWSGDT